MTTPSMFVVRVLAGFLFIVMTHADTTASLASQPGVLVGQGRLSVLFWDIYDIKLYTDSGRYDPDARVRLELNYLRPVKGHDIAEASIDQIADQGVTDEQVLTQWRTDLMALFPDVAVGDQLVGIHDPASGSTYYLNDNFLGTIADVQLSRRFFDIWLADTTSQPELRQQLLGLSE